MWSHINKEILNIESEEWSKSPESDFWKDSPGTSALQHIRNVHVRKENAGMRWSYLKMRRGYVPADTLS